MLLSADEAEIEAEIDAADAADAADAQYVVDDRTDGAADADSVDRADAAGAADGTRNVATATPAAPTAALSTMRVTTLIPPALEHPGAGAMTVDGAAKKTPSFALHFSHSNDHLPSQAGDGSTKNTWF